MQNQNEPHWVTINNENLEQNVIYKELLNLIENKEELKGILNPSGCSAMCNGSCGGH